MKMMNKVYYHGTDDERAALAIIKDGILPDKSKTVGLARPIDGRVYLTVNLEYALAYTLGGLMMGHELPKNWVEKSRYGYM
jgi:hypothetical protein